MRYVFSVVECPPKLEWMEMRYFYINLTNGINFYGSNVSCTCGFIIWFSVKDNDGY
jgi:hypothetical protein